MRNVGSVPAATAGPWAYERYVVEERRFSLGRQYRILDDKGNLVAFCRQKMFRLREDIRFYADEQEKVELFRMATQRIMDFAANFVLIDSGTGGTFASVRRKGWKSLLKDEWTICDATGQERGKYHEEGGFRSFMRRWGDIIATFVPARYRLDLIDQGQPRSAATVRERFQMWGDTYDVQRDPAAPLDGRVLIGLVVLADAMGVGGAGA